MKELLEKRLNELNDEFATHQRRADMATGAAREVQSLLDTLNQKLPLEGK